MSEYNKHIPVLLEEVLSYVDVNDKVLIDMTLGRGGHTEKILSKVSKDCRYYAVDRDINAIDYCKEKFKDKKIEYIHSNFSKAIDKIKESNEKSADFILFDIGVSSPQFDDPERGFSYRYDSKLDMRMNQDDKLTCYDVINTYSEEELVDIFSKYGQCHNAKRVASNITTRRKEKPIETTLQLVDIIKEVLPKKELNSVGHPCKQYFLALRYEVNDELKELEVGLKKAIEFLSDQGRLVVISFNFLEDKITKSIMNNYITNKKIDKYKKDEIEFPIYRYLTKKPILANEKELEENNRSKSAIMRVIERRNSL